VPAARGGGALRAERRRSTPDDDAERPGAVCRSAAPGSAGRGYFSFFFGAECIESNRCDAPFGGREDVTKQGSKKVGEVLPGVMKSLGLDRKLRESEIAREWSSIVGEAVARRSRPGGLKGRTMLVLAENNAWMQEIRFHQGEILARVRERFPELGIEGMRILLERERKAT
jgi:hypothetical protein